MLNADHVLCAVCTHINGLDKMNLAIVPSETVRGEAKWNQAIVHKQHKHTLIAISVCFWVRGMQS